MHAALFFLPDDRLSLAELSAARLDGVVTEMGEGYVVADIPEGAALRAHSLRSLLCPGVALAGPSSAWVHGAGDTPPAIHHLQRCVPQRGRYPRQARTVFHDAQLDDTDIQFLGGVPVTSPLRTMIQLARWADRYPENRRWAEYLHAHDPALAARAHGTLEPLPRFPGKHAALELLNETSALRTM